MRTVLRAEEKPREAFLGLAEAGLGGGGCGSGKGLKEASGPCSAKLISEWKRHCWASASKPGEQEVMFGTQTGSGQPNSTLPLTCSISVVLLWIWGAQGLGGLQDLD